MLSICRKYKPRSLIFKSIWTNPLLASLLQEHNIVHTMGLYSPLPWFLYLFLFLSLSFSLTPVIFPQPECLSARRETATDAGKDIQRDLYPLLLDVAGQHQDSHHRNQYERFKNIEHGILHNPSVTTLGHILQRSSILPQTVCICTFVIVWITVIRKGGRSYEAVAKKEYEGGQRKQTEKSTKTNFV